MYCIIVLYVLYCTESELGGHSHVSFSHDAPAQIVGTAGADTNTGSDTGINSSQQIPSLINGSSEYNTTTFSLNIPSYTVAHVLAYTVVTDIRILSLHC